VGISKLAAKAMDGVACLRATECRNGRLDRREAPETRVDLNEEMGRETGWLVHCGGRR
jgi:hypothetical protein